MKLALYPKYKASGVEWLGEVPEHWEIKRFKFCAQLRNEKLNAAPIDVEYLGLENVASFTGKILHTEKSEIEGNCNVYLKNDVLFGKLRPYLAKCMVAPNNGVCSTEFLVLRPLRFEPRFLLYLMLSPITIKVIDSSTFGAKMPRANWEFVGNCVQALPPIAEQIAIAAFLDRETVHIDSLIAKQERLIELSLEKRSALIGHAVTHGLNANVPQMESGAEWLGRVPKHWEVIRLKYLVSAPLQYGASEESGQQEDGAPRFIRITDIEADGRLRDEGACTLSPEIAQPYMLEDGELLFARSGATVGKSFLYRKIFGAACFAGYLIRAKPQKGRIAAEFLYAFVNSGNYWEWLAGNSVQATIQNVNAEKYNSLVVPLPPFAEQCAIVAYLDKETVKIDTLIAKSRQAVELMKEHRSALIAAAVTGKIDVRALANP